jgi:hypothetical protein
VCCAFSIQSSCIIGCSEFFGVRPQSQVFISTSRSICCTTFADSLPPSTRERPPGCKTVFIGGLPENVTEEILQEMFSNCGQIYSLRLSKKNFAHIRFTSLEAVDKALFYSGLFWRKVKLKLLRLLNILQ